MLLCLVVNPTTDNHIFFPFRFLYIISGKSVVICLLVNNKDHTFFFVLYIMFVRYKCNYVSLGEHIMFVRAEFVESQTVGVLC